MTLKKYLWEKAKKGSFTIEAACVMSVSYTHLTLPTTERV